MKNKALGRNERGKQNNIIAIKMEKRKRKKDSTNKTIVFGGRFGDLLHFSLADIGVMNCVRQV